MIGKRRGRESHNTIGDFLHDFDTNVLVLIKIRLLSISFLLNRSNESIQLQMQPTFGFVKAHAFLSDYYFKILRSVERLLLLKKPNCLPIK